MIVAGGIPGQTEALTTGIVTDVGMGLLTSVMALAIVLMIRHHDQLRHDEHQQHGATADASAKFSRTR